MPESEDWAIERIAIYEALIKAIDQRPAVVDLIANSSDEESAEQQIRELLGVSQAGATAILDMQLRKFSRSTKAKLVDNLVELRSNYA
jgi:DNA gyrase subunit A